MNRLRVLIDGRALIGRFSGVARFITELTRELSNRDDVQPILLCGQQIHETSSLPDDLERIQTSFDCSDRTPSRRRRWEQTHLPMIIEQSHADVFHATWNSGIPRDCPAPSVLTIHDLIAWHEPPTGLIHRLQLASQRATIRSSIKHATMIATVSEFVRQDVLRYIKDAQDRVVVIPNGVRATACHIPQVRIGTATRPYVLYVGGHEPRKNVASLLKTMQLYWNQFDTKLALHLTGKPDSMCLAAKNAYDQLQRESPILWLGQPSELKLADEYADASALLMLSLDEGFGLPVLEAMSYGCPVIASDRSSLPEVIADAGILLDPDDCNAIVAALRSLITNNDERERLIRLGLNRAADFSWEKVATRYTEMYRQVAHQSAKTSARPITC